VDSRKTQSNFSINYTILSKFKEYLGIILVFACSIFSFSTKTYLANVSILKTNLLAENDHVIDIFTSEDMENISLCIFQYLTVYYIVNWFILLVVVVAHGHGRPCY
jgi:hypothetical protein